MNKKRVVFIACIHFLTAITILVTAIMYTYAGMDEQELMHPVSFRIMQMIINFPLTLLVVYVYGRIFAMCITGFSIYATVLLILLSIPFNSAIWGVSIDAVLRTVFDKQPK